VTTLHEQPAADRGPRIALGGTPNRQRQTIAMQLGEAFAPFAAEGGYELPGIALAAVAS